MTFKEAVVASGLKSKKSFSRFNRRSYYHLTYNYGILLEKWNEIYNNMKHKSIKKIDEYTSLKEFNEDVSRILKYTYSPIRASSCSYDYTFINEDLIIETRIKIFKKMLSEENISKYKKPIIYIVERNTWEREVWRYGLEINKKNCKDISMLYEHFIKIFKEKKNFFIDSEILEDDKIEWEKYGNYMSSPKKVKKNFNIKSLLNKDTEEKLSPMLYKGGNLFEKTNRN